MPAITSIHNDKIKLIRALQAAGKTRRAEKRVVLEGARLITDALESGALPDFAVFTTESIEAGKPGVVLLETLRSHGVECVETSSEVIAQVSDTQTPQGWLAVFPLPDLAAPSALTLVLILDGVADPGNLGTILRTAAAAAVDLVLLAPGSVDAFNPKVLRGGMGAHFRVPVRRLSWPDIAERCAGLPLYLADAHAETVYSTLDWRTPAALIIGGEAHGADDQALRLAAQRIMIPMGNQAELLNAAVATAVILFEARRQRSA